MNLEKTTSFEREDNYSFLNATSEIDLNTILNNLNAKVDIYAHTQKAKNRILKDTRGDLENLIANINGQGETLSIINGKQIELESSISNLLDKKREFHTTNDSDMQKKNLLAQEIDNLESKIIQLNCSVKQYSRMANIFSENFEEIERKEDEETLLVILNDAEKRLKLLTIFESTIISSILPLSDESIQEIIAVLKKENASEADAVAFKQLLSDKLQSDQSNFIGQFEFLRNSKDNIASFLHDLLSYAPMSSLSNMGKRSIKFISEFLQYQKASFESITIADKIVSRNTEKLNQMISELDPSARPLKPSQVKRLTSIPLNELREYCQSNASNAACNAILQTIKYHTPDLNQSIIEKIKTNPEYTPEKRRLMIQKIQSGEFSIQNMNFGILISYMDNKEGGEWWQDCRNGSLYKVYNLTLNGGFMTAYRTGGAIYDRFNSLGVNPKQYNIKTYAGAEKIQNQLLSDIQKLTNNPQELASKKASRSKLKNHITQAAIYRDNLNQLIKSGQVKGKSLANLLELSDNFNREIRVTFNIQNKALQASLRGKASINALSHQSSNLARWISPVKYYSLKALPTAVFSTGLPAYNMIKGEISAGQALRDTGSNLKYCVPILGSYYCWKDAIEQPGVLNIATAIASSALDFAGMPLKLAGLGARFLWGTTKTTGINTIRRTFTSVSSKILLGSFGTSFAIDLLREEEMGTSTGTALNLAFEFLNLGKKTLDYTQPTSLNLLENQVSQELELSTQLMSAYETGN